MKNKINYKDIFVNIISILNVFLCIISLTIIGIICIVRKNVDKDNMEKFVSEYNIGAMINIDSSFIENVLNESLKNSGLNEETISEFINSEVVVNYKNEIINSIVGDILNNQNIEFEFKENEIEKLIYNNIPELTNKINSKIYEKIESKIPEVVDKLNKLLDEFKNKINNSEQVKLLKNYMIKMINLMDYLMIISLILLLINIFTMFGNIFIARKNVHGAFAYIGSTFVFASGVFCVIHKILSQIDEIKINNILMNIKWLIIIYLILGIILLVIYIIIAYKRKNNK